MKDALKKYWPEVLVVIGIIMEFAIKRLTEIEQSNEKTTVIGLLLAVLVALYARHFGGSKTQPNMTGAGSNPVPPPNPGYMRGSR